MSRNFYPTLPPKNISASSASSRVQLSRSNPQLEIALRVVNSGSKAVYLAFGNAEVEASPTNGIIVLPGALPEILNVPENFTHAAAACAGADTTTVQLTLGRCGK